MGITSKLAHCLSTAQQTIMDIQLPKVSSTMDTPAKETFDPDVIKKFLEKMRQQQQVSSSVDAPPPQNMFNSNANLSPDNVKNMFLEALKNAATAAASQEQVENQEPEVIDIEDEETQEEIVVVHEAPRPPKKRLWPCPLGGCSKKKHSSQAALNRHLKKVHLSDKKANSTVQARQPTKNNSTRSNPVDLSPENVKNMFLAALKKAATAAAQEQLEEQEPEVIDIEEEKTRGEVVLVPAPAPQSKKRVWPCPMDGCRKKKLPNQDALHRHLRKAHLSNEKGCDRCGRDFSKSIPDPKKFNLNFWRHRNGCNVNLLQWQCQSCPKTFPAKRDYLRHEARCMAAPRCAHCSEPLITKKAQKNHVCGTTSKIDML